MVLSPLLLRRWLGRGGHHCLVLLLISPSFLYYSRYIRNDIYITVWTMLLIAALFHFLRSREPRWFYWVRRADAIPGDQGERLHLWLIGLVFIREAILWEKVRP
jgi:predicted membrane-bound mannosyltransferase